ncbi:hypothetical protein Dimus_019530 [Dionaea muscipula]
MGGFLYWIIFAGFEEELGSAAETLQRSLSGVLLLSKEEPATTPTHRPSCIEPGEIEEPAPAGVPSDVKKRHFAVIAFEYYEAPGVPWDGWSRWPKSMGLSIKVH